MTDTQTNTQYKKPFIKRFERKEFYNPTSKGEILALSLEETLENLISQRNSLSYKMKTEIKGGNSQEVISKLEETLGNLKKDIQKAYSACVDAWKDVHKGKTL
jgi:hypothetical protein